MAGVAGSRVSGSLSTAPHQLRQLSMRPIPNVLPSCSPPAWGEKPVRQCQCHPVPQATQPALHQLLHRAEPSLSSAVCRLLLSFCLASREFCAPSWPQPRAPSVSEAAGEHVGRGAGQHGSCHVGDPARADTHRKRHLCGHTTGESRADLCGQSVRTRGAWKDARGVPNLPLQASVRRRLRHPHAPPAKEGRSVGAPSLRALRRFPWSPRLYMGCTT